MIESKTTRAWDPHGYHIILFYLQILACGNKEALAVAKACNLNFIRAEGYVFSHVADEGFTDADAGRLLRYRKHINAENIQVFTDIKKKHRYILRIIAFFISKI